jgi:glyoxylate utilization-related uncharacterized protein
LTGGEKMNVKVPNELSGNLGVTYYIGGFTSCGSWWGSEDAVCRYSKLYFPVSGEMEIEIDGKIYKGKPGELYLIPEGLRHSFRLTEKQQLKKLETEKQKMTEHNQKFISGVMAENVQLKNENEKLKKIIDNEPKNILEEPGLKQQVATLKTTLKKWQNMSADELRQLAEKKENAQNLGQKKSHFSR